MAYFILACVSSPSGHSACSVLLLVAASGERSPDAAPAGIFSSSESPILANLQRAGCKITECRYAGTTHAGEISTGRMQERSGWVE